MDDIPNLSYESMSDSQKVIYSGRTPFRFHENSISIETTDDDSQDELNRRIFPSIHDQSKLYRNEQEFQEEINRLKLQSTKRFKDKWDEILHRYSQIDDEIESDEIDLVTGKIVKDNGHLRSLRTGTTILSDIQIDGNIWSATYDLDRDFASRRKKELRNKERKRELKLKLKEKHMFHNPNLQKEPSSFGDVDVIDLQKNSSSNSLEDNLLLLNPSPTKKAKLSPTKEFRSSSPLKADDLLLSTPTKRKVPTFTENDSPTKANLSSLARRMINITVARGSTSNDELKTYFSDDSEREIVLNNSYHNSFDSRSSEYKIILNHSIINGSVKSISSESPGGEEDLKSETSETSHIDSPDNEESLYVKSVMKKQFEGSQDDFPNDEHITSPSYISYVNSIQGETNDILLNGVFSKHDSMGEEDTPQKEINSGIDFDDQFSIVTDPFIPNEETSASTNIYHCAFDDCCYCTGNKLLYQSHLVEKHICALNFLGYPVLLGNIKYDEKPKVSESTISTLTQQFPLVYKVPKLPLSEDSNPYKCELLVNNRPCQKIFLTKNDLFQHQDKHPLYCSSKKQVFICPVLGCGYMTDDGYLEWRFHFIKQRHHIDPKYRKYSSCDFVASDLDVDREREFLNDPNYKRYIKISESYKAKIDKISPNAVTKKDIAKEINEIFSDSGSDLGDSFYGEGDEKEKEYSFENGAKKHKFVENTITDRSNSMNQEEMDYGEKRIDQEEIKPAEREESFSEIDLSNILSKITKQREVSATEIPSISSFVTDSPILDNQENAIGYESIDELFDS